MYTNDSYAAETRPCRFFPFRLPIPTHLHIRRAAAVSQLAHRTPQPALQSLHNNTPLRSALVWLSIDVVNTDRVLVGPLVVIYDIVCDTLALALYTLKDDPAGSDSPSSITEGCLNTVEATRENLNFAKSFSGTPSRSCIRVFVWWNGSP